MFTPSDKKPWQADQSWQHVIVPKQWEPGDPGAHQSRLPLWLGHNVEVTAPTEGTPTTPPSASSSTPLPSASSSTPLPPPQDLLEVKMKALAERGDLIEMGALLKRLTPEAQQASYVLTQAIQSLEQSWSLPGTTAQSYCQVFRYCWNRIRGSEDAALKSQMGKLLLRYIIALESRPGAKKNRQKNDDLKKLYNLLMESLLPIWLRSDHVEDLKLAKLWMTKGMNHFSSKADLAPRLIASASRLAKSAPSEALSALKLVPKLSESHLTSLIAPWLKALSSLAATDKLQANTIAKEENRKFAGIPGFALQQHNTAQKAVDRLSAESDAAAFLKALTLLEVLDVYDADVWMKWWQNAVASQQWEVVAQGLDIFQRMSLMGRLPMAQGLLSQVFTALESLFNRDMLHVTDDMITPLGSLFLNLEASETPLNHLLPHFQKVVLSPETSMEMLQLNYDYLRSMLVNATYRRTRLSPAERQQIMEIWSSLVDKSPLLASLYAEPMAVAIQSYCEASQDNPDIFGSALMNPLLRRADASDTSDNIRIAAFGAFAGVWNSLNTWRPALPCDLDLSPVATLLRLLPLYDDSRKQLFYPRLYRPLYDAIKWPADTGAPEDCQAIQRHFDTYCRPIMEALRSNSFSIDQTLLLKKMAVEVMTGLPPSMQGRLTADNGLIASVVTELFTDLLNCVLYAEESLNLAHLKPLVASWSGYLLPTMHSLLDRLILKGSTAANDYVHILKDLIPQVINKEEWDTSGKLLMSLLPEFHKEGLFEVLQFICLLSIKNATALKANTRVEVVEYLWNGCVDIFDYLDTIRVHSTLVPVSKTIKTCQGLLLDVLTKIVTDPEIDFYTLQNVALLLSDITYRNVFLTDDSRWRVISEHMINQMIQISDGEPVLRVLKPFLEMQIDLYNDESNTQETRSAIMVTLLTLSSRMVGTMKKYAPIAIALIDKTLRSEGLVDSSHPPCDTTIVWAAYAERLEAQCTKESLSTVEEIQKVVDDAVWIHEGLRLMSPPSNPLAISTFIKVWLATVERQLNGVTLDLLSHSAFTKSLKQIWALFKYMLKSQQVDSASKKEMKARWLYALDTMEARLGSPLTDIHRALIDELRGVPLEIAAAQALTSLSTPKSSTSGSSSSSSVSRTGPKRGKKNKKKTGRSR